MRNFLTIWPAIAAMVICPFLCSAGFNGGSDCAEETPQTSCCEHCRGSESPAGDKDDDPQAPCCTSDCLCKGALPEKPRVELPPPVVTDMLPVEPHAIGPECVSGDAEWNRLRTPRTPDDGGRGLRIALCSFLC